MSKFNNYVPDVKLDEPEFYAADEIFPDNPKPSQDKFRQMHNVDDDDDFTIRGRQRDIFMKPQTSTKISNKRIAKKGSKKITKRKGSIKKSIKRKTSKKVRKHSKK